MVGGFFCTQLLAILSWSVFTSPVWGKAGHVFLQTAAMCTMAAGLYAVQKYKVCLQQLPRICLAVFFVAVTSIDMLILVHLLSTPSSLLHCHYSCPHHSTSPLLLYPLFSLSTHSQKQEQEPELTSVHSWLGVAAIALFCAAYLFGLGMWAYKVGGYARQSHTSSHIITPHHTSSHKHHRPSSHIIVYNRRTPYC